MKITNIVVQKNNKNRFSLYIDNEFAFGISYNTYKKYKIEKNQDVTTEFINNVLKEEEKNKAIEFALKLLSRRQHSKKELTDKMINKGYEDYLINNTINYLKEKNYLDDKEFARAFISDKLKFNKYGKKKMQYELYRKGISQEIIEESLYSIDREILMENAKYLAIKKVNSLKKIDKNKQQEKLFRLLTGKGYEYSLIKDIIKEIIE